MQKVQSYYERFISDIADSIQEEIEDNFKVVQMSITEDEGYYSAIVIYERGKNKWLN